MLGLALAVAALSAWGYRTIRVVGSDPGAIWSQAQADLQAGRIERVEQAVARLGRLREPTPLDRMLRGQLATALDRPDEALAELARVPDDHAMAARARLLAGQIELRRDRFRFAEEALARAIRLDPALVQAHRERIAIYGFQRRRSALAGEFLALAGLNDLTFKDMFLWGLMQGETWEPAGAERILERCIAADPADRWSRLALSESKRLLGATDEAEKALSGLALDTPEVIAAHVRIALDRNDPGRAERLMAAGPPRDPLLARLRGRLALSRRDLREALRHFRIAYDAEPDNHDALAGLIAVLTILGDREALEPLRVQFLRRDRLDRLIQRAASKPTSDDPELPLLLGDACAALHRDAEARGWYKVAIGRNPLDSRAQRALYRLGGAADRPRIKQGVSGP